MVRTKTSKIPAIVQQRPKPAARIVVGYLIDTARPRCWRSRTSFFWRASLAPTAPGSQGEGGIEVDDAGVFSAEGTSLRKWHTIVDYELQ